MQAAGCGAQLVPFVSLVQVPADLGQPGGYLDQIEKATADIDVQLVFCNAGYVLAGFVEKRYAMWHRPVQQHIAQLK